MTKNRTVITLAIMILTSTALITVHCVFAKPDSEMSGHVYCKGEVILVEDGMNVKGKDLRSAEIHLTANSLSKADFSDCNLSGSDLQETTFHRCSFRGANLTSANCYDSNFLECDLTDATINGTRYLPKTLNLDISKEQLCSTASYKNKDLSGIRFGATKLSGVDFVRFNLRNTAFRVTSLAGSRFDDAQISGSHFYGGKWPSGGMLMTQEQLASTLDFKRRQFIDGTLSDFDLSNFDLSRFNLTGCTFYNTDFSCVNFTDAVLTNCTFHDPKNLTLGQIKSTWNYKTNNMEWIILPKEIQDALDAEKKNEKKTE